MLPPAVGAFENPRSSRELISQPPGAPDAREPVGPTQLRQCGDARRLIAIAINECEKSGHYRPLPPPQDRCRIRVQHEHIKNVTTHPALTGEGGKLYCQPWEPDERQRSVLSTPGELGRRSTAEHAKSTVA